MSKQRRYKPSVRKDSAIAAALDLAEQSHYLKVTRDQIAAAVGVTGSAIQYHFKTMAQLRSELMRAAVKRERLIVIAQGLTTSDTQAVKAPIALQRRALLSIV